MTTPTFLTALALLLAVTFNVVPSAAQTSSGKYQTVGELRDEIISRLRADGRVKQVLPVPDDPAALTVTIAAPDGEDVTVHSYVGNLLGRLNVLEAKDPEVEIARFVRTMIALREEKPAFDSTRVFANIRHKSFIEQINAVGSQTAPEPEKATVYEALTGDIIVLYQYDSPESLSSLTYDSAGGNSLSELRAIARENIDREIPKLKQDKLSGTDSLFYIDGNSALTPAILLSNAFWSMIDQRCPEGNVVAIPRRDQVFVFCRRSGSALNYARLMINAAKQDGVDLLSDFIYERRGGRLEVVAE